MSLFFVDAETDGLYGAFLSIAALAADDDGKETDRFCASVRIKKEDIQSRWVRQNVFPYLENADLRFNDQADMLTAFWNFWIRHRNNETRCVAYVQYPVETRLFEECVRFDLPERALLAPFPIYDLSTLLCARGYGFDIDLQEFSGLKLTSHDAMNDVLMTAAVWNKLIYKR
ncbi:MAG: hypothetical protein K6G90_05720 [Clostridia bacterium]|nr:hypothetical protein [Clostridia bacterium]